MIALRGFSAVGVSLVEALKAMAAAPRDDGTSVVALLYSPRWCRLGLLAEKGGVTGADGEEIDLTDVFDARVFEEEMELRWLHEAEGKGRAVLLYEGVERAEWSAVEGWRELPIIEATEPIEQTYLLWGTAMEPAGTGWSRLATAQIGALDVPLTDPLGKRVVLRAREYLGEYLDGNIAVAEERLLGLEVAT